MNRPGMLAAGGTGAASDAAGRRTDSAGNTAVAAWLFIVVASLYLLCTAGHIYTPDGVVMLQVTESLVDRQSLSIPGLSDPSLGVMELRRRDGTSVRHSKYGLGFSLAVAPLYFVGRALAPHVPPDQLELFQIADTETARREQHARGEPIAGIAHEDFRWLWYDQRASAMREAFVAFCAAWTNSFIAAAIVVFIFLICRELGFTPSVSLATALLAGICSPLWPYAKDFFSEPLAGLALAAFLYFSLRGERDDESARPWLAAGVALGVAPLTKPALIVLLIPGAVLIANRVRAMATAPAWRALLMAAVGFTCPIATAAIYNVGRFGSFLETGYGDEVAKWTTPFVAGAVALLASPGRGLLFYFPLWVLTLAAARPFSSRPLFCGRGRTRDASPELTFILLCLVALIAVHAKWHMWEGGVCWGPRFLLPAIPLLVIPIACLLEVAPQSRGWRLAVASMAALSAAIAFSGTVVNYFEYANWLKWQVLTDPQFAAHGVTSAYQLFVLSPRYAALLGNWTFPRWDYYFIVDAMRHPGMVLGIYGLFAAGLVVGTIMLIRNVRTLNRTTAA